MKKLFAALAVLTFSVVANATDRTGAFALGYQTSFGGANTQTGLDGNWSVKYGLSSNATVQAIFGFNLAQGPDNENINIGARLLYDLVEAENSDFYTGLGVAYTWADSASAAGFTSATAGPSASDFLTFSVPLGFEFSLANVPNVAFSAEMGLVFAYETQEVIPGADKRWAFGSVGGNLGAAFTAGAHYYF